ncbi:TIGR03943 family putative permease subunit [Metabacillus litoralis]|uniref:TIGR03943 family putative permease subunit n=1 Tax=Metabacillus litoralis TaxID=152268 RepID=UPI00203AF277|nr:TIGR03943 family protein [Metabacillus litoralis]MCM3654173.1 TIGR03943 family protein [Metabacillus litoralis]
MKFHFQQAVRALILLTFTIFIFKLHFTGEMTKFINPKYLGLSQSASVIFLILFFVQTTRIWTIKESIHSHSHCEHNHQNHTCEHHHDHGDTPFTIKKLISYSIIIFPLLTGFLLPAKILDASIADKKGGMTILTNQKQTNNGGSSENGNLVKNENQYEENHVIDENINPNIMEQNSISEEEYDQLTQRLSASSNIVMNDAMFSTYYDEIKVDIQKFKGKRIVLKGFVYKENGFNKNQLVISRFLITHCVADASIIGFLSEFPEASTVKEDTWIEANGVLDIATYNGTELPIIKITDWIQISEPKEPYLYPLSIKIM